MKITNTKELREYLLACLEDVRSGDITEKEVKMVCDLAQQVYNTIKTDMAVAHLNVPEIGPNTRLLK